MNHELHAQINEILRGERARFMDNLQGSVAVRDLINRLPRVEVHLRDMHVRSVVEPALPGAKILEFRPAA